MGGIPTKKTFGVINKPFLLCIGPTKLAVTNMRSIVASLAICLPIWWVSKIIHKFKTTISTNQLAF
jgi:hypothetical protein